MTTTFPPNHKTSEHRYIALCSKCKTGLEDRMRRGFFVKNFLFWLPIRKYICYKCKRGQYVWVNNN
ncbi:MAG: hypothetical protein JWR05_2444 [Mucilaginibacter sp.]|nr:hypothetical protein [Mucilaginibacter sp.]